LKLSSRVPIQPAMVPYLWRRHLGILRAVLAFACVVLYLVSPVPASPAIALVVGLFAIYTIFILFRDNIENRIYELYPLMLDVVFFFICSLHPTSEGLWLSTVTYFYLLCFSSLLYDWRVVAAIVVICDAFFLGIRPMPTYRLWPTVLLSGVFATVFAMQRESFQARLSWALKRSVLARMQAERARESERERIAADFHDGPLQSFISFQMRLEIVRKLLQRDTNQAREELEQLQELGKSQVTELRSFVRNMQPLEVDEAGLGVSIREVVSTFERDSGIACTLICGDLPGITGTDFATEVLQIIREALNNVRKHSKASRVSIALEVMGHTLEIGIQDDGSGFPFSGNYSLDELDLLRLGPRSIKRRIRTLGGELTLESRPSNGAGLKIRIPT
jgi:signal transduction histidine kinase